MTTELKPCPFCGSKDLEIVHVDIRDREGRPMQIACADCGANGSMEYFEDDDTSLEEVARVTKWNDRRAAPPAPGQGDTKDHGHEIAMLAECYAAPEPATNEELPGGRALYDLAVADLQERIRDLQALGYTVTAEPSPPAPIAKLVAEQQDCPPEFDAVFAKRSREMLATEPPAQSYRERAEAYTNKFINYGGIEAVKAVDALAAELAAVAEEARPKPNSTDKAVVDALIDRHKGLPGSSDEWCICLSDQFRHDLEVIMAAVAEAATKAERERCAGILASILSGLSEYVDASLIGSDDATLDADGKAIKKVCDESAAAIRAAK